MQWPLNSSLQERSHSGLPVWGPTSQRLDFRQTSLWINSFLPCPKKNNLWLATQHSSLYSSSAWQDLPVPRTTSQLEMQKDKKKPCNGGKWAAVYAFPLDFCSCSSVAAPVSVDRAVTQNSCKRVRDSGHFSILLHVKHWNDVLFFSWGVGRGKPAVYKAHLHSWT